MAQKAFEVTGGQGSLLLMDPTTHEEHINPDIHTPHEAAVEAGPSVSLVERNLHLLGTLSLLGQISQRSGFARAIDSPYTRRRIEEQYNGREDIVNEHAQQNSQEMLKEAKREFAEAFGLEELQTSGLLDREEAKELALESFGAFVRSYSNSHNRQARDKYKKKLSRNVKILEENEK